MQGQRLDFPLVVDLEADLRDHDFVEESGCRFLPIRSTYGTSVRMSKSREEMLSAMEPAKALTLGCYGEDMAAYCYLQLAEKAERERDRLEFREMVAEEQEHRDRLRTDVP